MIKLVSIILFTSLSISCSNKQQNQQSFNVIAFDEKVAFLNDIKRSFNSIDISKFTNITFSSYDVRFMEAFPQKITKIKDQLNHDDYEFFIAQINEYEKLENENIEIDFKMNGFNSISKSKLQSFGKTHDELWANFKKTYGEKSLLILSKPLFSKDLQLVILEIHVISETETNSNKKLYAFKKLENKWKLYSEL